MAHTDRWGGSWLPTRYADVYAIAHDIAKFPSGNGISVVPMVDHRPRRDAPGPALRSSRPVSLRSAPTRRCTRGPGGSCCRR